MHPYSFRRYSLTLNTPTGAAWKNSKYRANRRLMCVFPLPGKPQKQMAILSMAMGKMDNGMLFSMLCPTAAEAPGAACGSGLYTLYAHTSRPLKADATGMTDVGISSVSSANKLSCDTDLGAKVSHFGDPGAFGGAAGASVSSDCNATVVTAMVLKSSSIPAIC